MQRRCGDCQLCCRVLPTKEIDKPANTRCVHQCRSGCSIYATRPFSCQAWSCQWLLGFDVGQRPDRSHLVVDPVPDFVLLTPTAGGESIKQAVVQVWCDPNFPDAHRDAGFRRWLDAERKVALIRYGSSKGFGLFPPSITGGHWFEHPGGDYTLPEHTLMETLAEVGDQLGNTEIVHVDTAEEAFDALRRKATP